MTDKPLDIFGDKKYEDLDFLTKALEPISYSLNEKIALLPKEIEVTIDDLLPHVTSYYDGLPTVEFPDVLHCMLQKILNTSFTSSEEREFGEFYVWSVTDSCVIDFDRKRIMGSMKLVRIKEAFTEEELLSKMDSDGLETICRIDTHIASMERFNEILDLMGCDLKGKSFKNKMYDLKRAYNTAMKENKWNIRDVDLSNKIGVWIRKYIETGDLAAMTNFCKIKAITHRGYPIYSIEEEQ